MRPALTTYGFLAAVRTNTDTLHHVFHHLFTLLAELIPRAMVIPAINARHFTKCFLFTGQMSVADRHLEFLVPLAAYFKIGVNNAT